MSDLYVIFTMDCEAVNEFAAEGGPPDWEFSKRSIEGYCNLLNSEGFMPTLFLVPLTAEKLSSFLGNLSQTCFETALHLHPQDYGYKDYLGSYNFDMQYKMIGEAKDRFTQALKSEPQSFRGGNLSANDHTFPVLKELGFKQGSLSVCNRNFTRVRSNWKGGHLYPYHVSDANRLIEGDMDFLEVPVTSDWESIMWGGLTPLELRVEMVDARSHGFTIRKNIKRQLDENFKAPVIVVLTHNIFDYSDPLEFRTTVLKGIIKEINDCADEFDLNIKGPTLSSYHEEFDLL